MIDVDQLDQKMTQWPCFIHNAYEERHNSITKEVQWNSGFICIKAVQGLHLAVNEKSQRRYTQQVTDRHSMKSRCSVLHKHLHRYKLSM